MPATVILYKIYFGFLALLGLLFAVVGTLGVMGITETEPGLLDLLLAEGDEEALKALDEQQQQEQLEMAIAGPIIFAVYLFGLLMPRRNWALPVANALLGLSLLACITIIPGVLLLVFINQRPVREYFAAPIS